jgi:hypothetical protein
MASKLYREAELVANDKKTNSLLINKKQNDDQSDYFFEEHVRQEKAKCFFCYSTVNLNPDFKKRSKLICKIGDKINLNQKSGFIINDENVYYYETDWIYEQHCFEVCVDYVCSEPEIGTIT